MRCEYHRLEALLNPLKDVEAQENSAQSQKVDPDASRPEYAHAGRGGAGNYFKPTAPAAATALPGDLSTSIKQDTIPEGGYLGRGGVGNFRGDPEKKISESIAREREADEESYEKTVKDVEQGLKSPEKAHLSSEKLGAQ